MAHVTPRRADSVTNVSRTTFHVHQNKKLLILGTTSKRDVLEALELSQMFDSVLRLPTITKGDEMARVLAEIEVRTPSAHTHTTPTDH